MSIVCDVSNSPSLRPARGGDILGDLSRQTSRIRLIVPPERPVVYLDYPVHTNVGDLLIEKGTERVLAAHGYRVIDRRSAYDFGPAVRARIPGDATILLHGGGNFGDIYPLHQAFRACVIAAFPHHRIVMMPQTLHFGCARGMDECARLFAGHPDLHVCLRDARSYELFRRRFANPAYLIPDMAHALWDEYRTAAVPERGGRLVFARNDIERRALPGGDGAAKDWWDLLGARDKLAYEVLARLHLHHDRIGARWSLHPAWRVFRERLIAKARRLLDDYDTVVTNRLHMAMFALMLGRKVVMADNSYGKLSSYHETWLADCPDLEFVA